MSLLSRRACKSSSSSHALSLSPTTSEIGEGKIDDCERTENLRCSFCSVLQEALHSLLLCHWHNRDYQEIPCIPSLQVLIAKQGVIESADLFLRLSGPGNLWEEALISKLEAIDLLGIDIRDPDGILLQLLADVQAERSRRRIVNLITRTAMHDKPMNKTFDPGNLINSRSPTLLRGPSTSRRQWLIHFLTDPRPGYNPARPSFVLRAEDALVAVVDDFCPQVH
mmetsp:Transcript_25888/g.58369  ORF Transcript_25888/g.58369 Transcript_25888/m.58369 type:complete len:224 (-) Transcript_25888:479-1150(-)